MKFKLVSGTIKKKQIKKKNQSLTEKLNLIIINKEIKFNKSKI